MPERTPSQTAGPFFHDALRWKDGERASFLEPGERVVLAGRIVDGAGDPVGDALIETWQRAPSGDPPRPAQGNAKPTGFARVETAPDGSYRIETLMPGGSAAPFLDVALFARGLLKPLRTRVYLAPEARVRAEAVLVPLAGSPRLATLVATPQGAGAYRWDIRLQGEGETVFFAL
jgi:protocatechuate 3,4-dioxygenase, alpha subunit